MSKTYISLAFTFFMSVSPACYAKAAPSDVESMRQIMLKAGVPGMSISVIDGQNERAIALGSRGVHHASKVDSKTRFKVGSISKSFTGLAIALLAHEGTLDLSEPIHHRLPELTALNYKRGKPLTIKSFLMHEVDLDLPALDVLLWPQPNRYTVHDVLSAALQVRRIELPAGQISYSNAAYVMLGEVVRRTSGLPFEGFVQQRIFHPLGMHQCAYGNIRNGHTARANLAVPHIELRGRTIPIRKDKGTVPVGIDAAAAGARCSASDMLKWLRFLADSSTSDRRLSDALSLAIALDPKCDLLRNTACGRTQYAFGFEVSTDDSNHFLTHSGGVAGMYSTYVVWPKTRQGFAVMLNKSSLTARHQLVQFIHQWLAKKLPEQLHNNSVDPPGEVALLDRSSKLSHRTISALHGRYQSNWLGEVSIYRQNDHVILDVLRSPRLKGLVKVVGHQMSVHWLDPAVGSDSLLDITSMNGKRVNEFRLLPIAQSDFDFSYITFQRDKRTSPAGRM
jgi:CubicO group peptidase (beta-lactamase class C family)